MRQMKAGHSKIVLAGNPGRKAMWFDDYYKEKTTVDKERWTTLKPTYHCIKKWLPKDMLEHIAQMQKTDIETYRQMYLGDLEAAGWDSVFHSFVTTNHYIPREQLMVTDRKLGLNAIINSIIIAVDDAESRDALASSAITVHKNGQLRVQESLYISMKELPEKPALTQRCDKVVEFLDYIQKHFNSDRRLPLIMTFDSASGMYRQMQVQAKTDKNFMRWRGVKLYAYSSKLDKSDQLDECNAAFAKNILSVVNVDRFSPQYTNSHLVKQIKELRYNDNKQIDHNIPNDCTDALQYGVMTVLRNPYSLSFPERRSLYDRDNSQEIFLDKLQNELQRG